MNADKKKIIWAYIENHFPGHEIIEINEQSSRTGQGYNLALKKEQRTVYIVSVLDEAVENIESAAVTELLDSYSVADVMRNIGDFPVVVTCSGCIFGSP